MAINQVSGGLGDWSIQLAPQTPREILSRLRYLGHICVSAGRDDPRVAGDSLLRAARYVGPLRGLSSTGQGYTLHGSGMAYWLGDEDNKGALLESPVVLTATSFATAIGALLPAAVHSGTLYSVPGTFTGTFQYQTSRSAIDFLCETMGAVWRVNGDATLDAGLATSLYQTTPKVAIIRRRSGTDLYLRALPGTAELDEDIQDTTTRVVLYSTDSNGVVVPSATADINPALNPFKDLFGNPVVITRLSQETVTNATNATARAQLELNRYSSPRDAITLSSSGYDITGDLVVGDSVYVYDPEVGLFDPTGTVETVFQGERLNPVVLTVNQLTWPVTAGMGLSYRDPDGVWTDLTDYLAPESDDTRIVVGGYNRSLVSAGGGTVTPGSVIGVNASVPNAPTFVTPFTLAVYQSAGSGITKAQVQLVWLKPTNTDGSTFIDGAYYEIRYRRSGATGWDLNRASIDTLQLLIQELTPGVDYEFQIRAVDNSPTPNYSAWSGTQTVTTTGDTVAPLTPAAPVAASSQTAVLLMHFLGASTGGTFNLASDLHHLEAHAGTVTGFTTSDATLLGLMTANKGMMAAGAPAIGTFQVAATTLLYFKVVAVDESGNKSGSSAAVSSTAALIDSAHISGLVVDKLLAGTLLVSVINAGSIQNAASGPYRYKLDSTGFKIYGADGSTIVINLDAATASAVVTGTLQTGLSPSPRITVDGSASEIRVYADATRYTKLYQYVPAGYTGDHAVELKSLTGTSTPGLNRISRVTLLPDAIYLSVEPSTGPTTPYAQALVARTFIDIGLFNGSGAADGGRMNLEPGYSEFGYVPNGGLRGQLRFSNGGIVRLWGKFWDDPNQDNDECAFAGETAVDITFGSLSMIYGATMLSKSIPTYSIDGTKARSRINSNTLSGFAVEWEVIGTGSNIIRWMAWRADI